jgi:hypothetical protein
LTFVITSRLRKKNRWHSTPGLPIVYHFPTVEYAFGLNSSHYNRSEDNLLEQAASRFVLFRAVYRHGRGLSGVYQRFFRRMDEPDCVASKCRNALAIASYSVRSTRRENICATYRLRHCKTLVGPEACDLWDSCCRDDEPPRVMYLYD